MPWPRELKSAHVGGVAFGAALLLRLWLLQRYPVMSGVDSYARLAHSETLLLSGWLPGYQSVVAATSLLTRDILAHRLVVVLISASSVGLGAALVGRCLGPLAGLTAGLIAGLNLNYALVSLGLYQEPLLALLLAAAGLAATKGRPTAAALLLMGAQATRYEAWLVCCVVAAGWLWSGRWRHALALGLVPLLWVSLAWEHTPTGAGSLQQQAAPGEVAAMLWGLLKYWVGWPVLLAGGLGLGLFARTRQPRLLAACGASLLLIGVFLLTVSAYAPRDNARQILTLTLLIAVFAGHAVQRLAPGRGQVVGVGAAVVMSLLPLQHLSDVDGWYGSGVEPGVLEGAPELRARAHAGCRVVVLAQGFPRYPQAESHACLHVGAYTGLSDDVVRCDAGFHDATPEELSAAGVALALRVGDFTPWRPLHHAVEDADRWEVAVQRPGFTLFQRRGASGCVGG